MNLSKLLSDECFYSDSQFTTKKMFLELINKFKDDIGKRDCERFTLGYEDPLYFYAGLFALVSMGKKIVILPNLKPGTLEKYSDCYDFYYCTSIDVNSRGSKTTGVFLDLKSSVVFYTSGSSGDPKAITKSFGHLYAEVKVLESSFMDVKQTTMFTSSVSHFHIYGLLFRGLWPIMTKKTLYRKLVKFPLDFREIENCGRDICYVSSPAILKRLDVNLRVSKIKHIVSSGGKLEKEVALRCRDIFSNIPIEIYGSTETGGIATRSWNRGEAWNPLRNVTLSLGPDFKLVVKSPFFSQEKIEMEDTVDFLEDGRFLLKGRKDRIVKIEEKRVSLDEVEKILKKIESIDDAHCFVLSEEKRSILVCIACLRPYQALSLKEKRVKIIKIKDHLRKFFDDVLIPRKIIFLENLPYDERGKLKRKDLERIFGEN